MKSGTFLITLFATLTVAIPFSTPTGKVATSHEFPEVDIVSKTPEELPNEERDLGDLCLKFCEVNEWVCKHCTKKPAV
jgi:hypothetical protein